MLEKEQIFAFPPVVMLFPGELRPSRDIRLSGFMREDKKYKENWSVKMSKFFIFHAMLNPLLLFHTTKDNKSEAAKSCLAK